MLTVSPRRRLIRWPSRGALLLLACYVAVLLYVQISARVLRHRAENLLIVVRELQVNKSTWVDLQQIMTRWGAHGHNEGSCTAERCDYTVWLSDLPVNPRYADLVLFFSNLGHGHWASADLHVSLEKGVVTRATYGLSVIVPKGYGARWEREQPQSPGYVPYSTGMYQLIARATEQSELSQLCCRWPDPVPHPNYRLRKPNGCEGCLAIWTEFTPQATSAERLRMTSFNFDCVTRWTPCADEEDIMPVAGAEYYQQTMQSQARNDRQSRCAYSVAELSSAALNAAVARIESLPKQPGSYTEGPRVRWMKQLGGAVSWKQNEAVMFHASTESPQGKLIWNAFLDRKPLILLYPSSPDKNILEIYTCGILPDTEQNEKEVSAGVALGKGIPE
jgi:hypothetical protein